jgi:(R)-citramalate synthase
MATPTNNLQGVGTNPRRARKKAGTASIPRSVEIMDTTLRDGEQAEGISMIPEEKLMIAGQLLKKVGVDRIEITSARSSDGEALALGQIMKWAKKEGFEDRVEALGFVDGGASVEWIRQTGCRVVNLLTKGSRKHCTQQLGQTLEQHLANIGQTVVPGAGKGMTFNVYLEDWSGGMLASPDYVFDLIDGLNKLPVRRIMLCDTLGILNPRQVGEFVGAIVAAHPDRHFDFHGHNDYGLAVANTLAAVEAGARGVHMTVNGMGERAGNTPLDEVVVALRDHLNVKTSVKEKALKDIGRLVEVFSGRRIAANKPITGENVFTQTAGVHADGDMKGDLYESRLRPARFGQDRHYAMGKLMGKASLEFNLRKLNIALDKEQKEVVLKRIVELSDQKKVVTVSDLPFIIADVLQTPEHRLFEVKDYSVTSTQSLPPTATIIVRCRDKEFMATAMGDGGYDAFMRALRSIAPKMKLKIPRLLDYEVHIPPGGKTDALVETTIKWEGGLKTRAVHSDQLVAAIDATAHAVNLFALGRKA